MFPLAESSFFTVRSLGPSLLECGRGLRGFPTKYPVFFFGVPLCTFLARYADIFHNLSRGCGVSICAFPLMSLNDWPHFANSTNALRELGPNPPNSIHLCLVTQCWWSRAHKPPMAGCCAAFTGGWYFVDSTSTFIPVDRASQLKYCAGLILLSVSNPA